jgi:hypothetical protein
MRRLARVLGAITVGCVCASGAAACNAETHNAGASNAPGAGDIHVGSGAFSEGESIPSRFTCEGKDISPELGWKGVPGKAKTLALIVQDPDAPDPAAPKRIWTHWVVYDVPASTQEFAEGVTELPAGSKEGDNDWQAPGYRGPCPPIGRHRYFFDVYALDGTLGDLHEPSRQALLDAMQGHIVATGALMGTYQKTK